MSVLLSVGGRGAGSAGRVRCLPLPSHLAIPCCFAHAALCAASTKERAKDLINEGGSRPAGAAGAAGFVLFCSSVTQHAADCKGRKHAGVVNGGRVVVRGESHSPVPVQEISRTFAALYSVLA
eukprot:560645-Rhodomonas_salina.1